MYYTNTLSNAAANNNNNMRIMYLIPLIDKTISLTVGCVRTSKTILLTFLFDCYLSSGIKTLLGMNQDISLCYSNWFGLG